MAKMMVYSVYDSKVKYFQSPLFMRNRGEALRSWGQVSNDPKHAISQFPTDFALMELGEFDDQTGKFTQHEVPDSLGLAIQFKESPQGATPLFDRSNSV